MAIDWIFENCYKQRAGESGLCDSRSLCVLHNGNVSTAGKVAYLPIYMLMLVEKEKSAAEMIYRIDLSMLQEDR